MLKLNLAYPDKSEIKYKISKFPDGQQDIVILGIPSNDELHEHCTIISRFNSWKDLELIACAKRALDAFGYKVSLYIPYLLGARSDRKFVTGGNSYLVNVLAPVLNNLDFYCIEVMDAHSDVAAACIKNLNNLKNYNLIDYYLRSEGKNGIVWVSPDAGAYKKVFDVAKYFGMGNIVTAMKHRDIETGNIISTEIQIPDSLKNHRFVIVDDICDGGRTFIELSKAINHATDERNDNIDLVVTHGIFSAGFEMLKEHLSNIYCTNSYSDIETGFVRQLKVL